MPDLDPIVQPRQPVPQPEAAQSEVAPPNRPRPIHPDVLLRAAVGLGVVMIAAGFVWINVLVGGRLEQALAWQDAGWLLPGLAAGAAFVWLIWHFGQRLAAFRRIATLLDETLDLSAMHFHHVLLFSLLAAFPEEILFRGALQSQIGLVLTALIFGALHALTRFYFLYAASAGLLLGALFALTGTLWTPIGAHFAIDLIMFLLLLQRKHHIVT